MNKADYETKKMIRDILLNGCLDKNPRPRYADGTPAHTSSVNHRMITYDIAKGEFPLITLRPIAVRSAIAELLWIYQKQSSDLVVFDELLGKRTWEENHKINNWWEPWALRNPDGTYILNEDGHPHIGQCYGQTVKTHDLVNKVIEGLTKDPDGRRHIINMWQEDDFKKPHGLKPCAYQTIWNVRHSKNGYDYLDMMLFQRSSDFMAAGCINQVQYAVFLVIMAEILGYTPGQFTWVVDNVQIYDRHRENARKMLERESIYCEPHCEVNVVPTGDTSNKCSAAKHAFYSLCPEDIQITGYPLDKIKETNPKLDFEIAI